MADSVRLQPNKDPVGLVRDRRHCIVVTHMPVAPHVLELGRLVYLAYRLVICHCFRVPAQLTL